MRSKNNLTNGTETDRVLREGAVEARQLSTSLINETPSPLNPYHSTQRTLRGRTVQQLSDEGFLSALYLSFRGSHPSADQSELLSLFAACLLMCSPRDSAVRTTVAAAVGRTQAEHLLPIAATALGSGQSTGAATVGKAMRALRRSLKMSPSRTAERLRADGRVLLGFGTTFNGIDPWPSEILEQLARAQAAGPCLERAVQLNEEYKKEGKGILISGVAAAVFCDLGFLPRQAVVLMQYLQLPSVLSQSLDAYGRLDQDTFPSDDDYHIEDSKGDY